MNHSAPLSAARAAAERRAAETSPLGERAARWIEAFSEWANPILVKETRQALKSRQFVVTFLIVLVGCWIASFGVVAYLGPQIRYSASGPDLFLWYYGILAGALAIVVPFSAFRSLAAEQEDNTFDLLSITTLSSRQIVSGKLWSAVAQILIYLSAVVPFMAFTFLLRGLDVLSVLVLLALALAGSIGLSVVGLLVGTVSRVRHTQVLISVAFVLGLVLAFWGSVVLAEQFLRESQYLLRDWEFWLSIAIAATLYATTFALFHSAAAAQIAFPSENRSTPLRVRMMVQQACFCGWLAVPLWLYPDQRAVLVEMTSLFAVAVAGGYWFVMGAFMTGEWPLLSRRVQRRLPQTAWGRLLFTWFNPGPGSGYLFAVANLTAIVAMAEGAVALTPNPARNVPVADFHVFCLLTWSYVIGYLGLGRLLINFARRWAFVPMAAAMLIQMILVLAGIGVPVVIDALSPGNRLGGYSLTHLSNPFWTLLELAESGLVAIDGATAPLLVAALALAALLLNLRSVGSELYRQRIATPLRVLEEEAAGPLANVAKPLNPWDAAAEDEDAVDEVADDSDDKSPRDPA